MEVKSQLRKGTLILKMPKEVDHHVAGQIREETDLPLETYHIHKLVFDFEQTRFMDSSGIGMILGRCRKLHFLEGEVEAVHVSSQVNKIFVVSGLHNMVTIERENEEKNV